MNRYATTLVLLVLSWALVAQDASPSFGSLRFSLVPPKDVRWETVQIRYFATGPAGGYGSFLRQQTGLSAYELAAPGVNVKVIAYIPGCQIDTLELSAGMPTMQPLRCRPLASVRLAGQIVPSDVLVDKITVVEAGYVADWSHEFFGIMDGMVETFPVATVTPDGDGTFKISLPDFAKDAVSTRWKHGGEWQFLLREGGSGNIVATLRPMQSKGNVTGLAVRSSYPGTVNFVATRN